MGSEISIRFLGRCAALVAVIYGATALAATPGLQQLAPLPADAVTLGIATFDQAGPPTAAQVSAIRAHGVAARGLQSLPLAFVRGTRAQLQSLVGKGLARDIYPDRRFEMQSAQSNVSMGVAAVHAAGYTGKGVRVAVVDAGIDASNPDLADHVVHNYSVFSAEYLHLDPSAGPGPVVIDFNDGPYSNNDQETGHGTAVAGIVAADGTSDPALLGVAPDAEIIGYQMGQGGEGGSILTAFDHILSHPELGIAVVNCSFGAQAWQEFDPHYPLHVATRAMVDHGITVVIASGNYGAGDTEMTLNSLATPPWVISVGSVSTANAHSDFSSNGLVGDNADLTPLVDGHVRYEGDRIGLYHPTLVAPGENITVICATGVAMFDGGVPCIPGVNASYMASGTSLATPQVSGVVALLKQARPDLTPAEIRQVLEATAEPVPGRQLWEVGYGAVDARAALELVTSGGFRSRLRKRLGEAEARVLADRPWQTLASEHWTWAAERFVTPAMPHSRNLELEVPKGTDALHVAIAYPTAPYSAGANSSDYSVKVLDAAGNELGTTAAAAAAGVSSLIVDLRSLSPVFGAWTLEVTANASASDPPAVDYESLMGEDVTVTAALLLAQPSAPAFVPAGSLHLAFVPDSGSASGLRSPEGCDVEVGVAQGLLGPDAGKTCHSATFGWLATYNQNVPATFTTEPLPESLTVGGAASVKFYVSDPAYASESPTYGRLEFWLEEIRADGAARRFGEGLAPGATGGIEAQLPLATRTIPAGSRLRLVLREAAAISSSARLLFGGPVYGDAGLTLGVGAAPHQSGGEARSAAASASAVTAGSPDYSLLGVLFFAALASSSRARRVRQ